MIQVGDIGVLRALEPSDLDWLYTIENDASLWHLGISKEPWSKAVLASYIDAQPVIYFAMVSCDSYLR